MCSLLNMNAVTALVLALAVGLVHCEIQQDLSKEPDEDLFFPESLLVDPDEDTDTSYGYNSLEAPKEDSKSVLETPEEVDKNELKGSKDEDLNRIAGTKPPNRMISIYDLANAVVIPSKSTKNNFDRSYFHSSEHRSDEENSSETSEEENSSETSEEDDDDSEEGSATYEGSGSPHFKWDMEGSGDEYGSGEVDSSGDFNVGQEDYENSIDLLAEADLEEFIPIKTGNLSADIDSQIDVEYEEDDDISIYSPPKNNLVIHGYKGSPIGEMAKIDFLENEMYQVKGQISQLSARMEQQSNDISHLQQIILQLQEQINMLIYRQYLPRD